MFGCFSPKKLPQSFEEVKAETTRTLEAKHQREIAALEEKHKKEVAELKKKITQYEAKLGIKSQGVGSAEPIEQNEPAGHSTQSPTLVIGRLSAAIVAFW